MLANNLRLRRIFFNFSFRHLQEDVSFEDFQECCVLYFHASKNLRSKMREKSSKRSELMKMIILNTAVFNDLTLKIENDEYDVQIV